MPRRNIKIDDDVFDRLNADRKERGYSWSVYLKRIHEVATDKPANVLPDDERERLADDVADEVVDRLLRDMDTTAYSNLP